VSCEAQETYIVLPLCQLCDEGGKLERFKLINNVALLLRADHRAYSIEVIENYDTRLLPNRLSVFSQDIFKGRIDGINLLDLR
jgi:hypothetical protein